MSYSRPQSPFDQARSYMQRSGIPVTIALIGITAFLFIVDLFTHSGAVRWFMFTEAPSFISLWTMFAYPLLTPASSPVSYFFLIFDCYWLWFVGGSLERSWGSARFAFFFFAVSLATVLSLWVGSLLLHDRAEFLGLAWPLACLTVAWATLNPTLTVLLMVVVPIQARWLALFLVGATYIMTFFGNPALGLFALLGPLLAWQAVKQGWINGLPIFRSNRRPALRMVNSGSNPYRSLDDAAPRFSLNPLAWYRNWQQERRLKKLLRKSGFTNQEDERRL